MLRVEKPIFYEIIDGSILWSLFQQTSAENMRDPRFERNIFILFKMKACDSFYRSHNDTLGWVRGYDPSLKHDCVDMDSEWHNISHNSVLDYTNHARPQ